MRLTQPLRSALLCGFEEDLPVILTRHVLVCILALFCSTQVSFLWVRLNWKVALLVPPPNVPQLLTGIQNMLTRSSKSSAVWVLGYQPPLCHIDSLTQTQISTKMVLQSNELQQRWERENCMGGNDPFLLQSKVGVVQSKSITCQTQEGK